MNDTGRALERKWGFKSGESGPPRPAKPISAGAHHCHIASTSMDAEAPNQEAAIAILSLACQAYFKDFCDSLENTKWNNELSSSIVEDELGRFRLWANNIGAAKTGRASLDYRLRDTAYLFQNVKSLLEALEKTLRKGFIAHWNC